MICPLCGSEKIKYYFTKNKFKLYQCLACELVFVYPFPANLEKIYGQEYFKKSAGKTDFGYVDYEKDKRAMASIFIKYLKKLEKLTPGRKIFDVGAATGYFLDRARQRGWRTFGSEISEYAVFKNKAKGHQVFYGGLPELESAGEFDAVTMWDVLEHLRDPKAYLKAAAGMLKAGGLLVINTVDKSSCWARLWGKQWHLIVPPEHLLYFSRKNLEMLLNDNGFTIIEIKKPGKKFTLSYIFKTAYSWQRLQIWKILSEYFDKPGWRKIYIPINFRDNISILARKEKNE